VPLDHAASPAHAVPLDPRVPLEQPVLAAYKAYGEPLAPPDLAALREPLAPREPPVLAV